VAAAVEATKVEVAVEATIVKVVDAAVVTATSLSLLG
jgi:hypothetical protein